MNSVRFNGALWQLLGADCDERESHSPDLSRAGAISGLGAYLHSKLESVSVA